MYRKVAARSGNITCSLFIFSVAAPSAVAVVELQAAVRHVQRQGPVVVFCDDMSKGVMIKRKS